MTGSRWTYTTCPCEKNEAFLVATEDVSMSTLHLSELGKPRFLSALTCQPASSRNAMIFLKIVFISLAGGGGERKDKQGMGEGQRQKEEQAPS